MRIRRELGRRGIHVLGTLCVLATVSLLSPGVRVVRAGDAAPATPAAGEPPARTAPAPIVTAADVETARRPGVPAIEVAPGVTVLNTRGFNYGPPPTALEPEALDLEKSGR